VLVVNNKKNIEKNKGTYGKESAKKVLAKRLVS